MGDKARTIVYQYDPTTRLGQMEVGGHFKYHFTPLYEEGYGHGRWYVHIIREGGSAEGSYEHTKSDHPDDISRTMHAWGSNTLSVTDWDQVEMGERRRQGKVAPGFFQRMTRHAELIYEYNPETRTGSVTVNGEVREFGIFHHSGWEIRWWTERDTWGRREYQIANSNHELESMRFHGLNGQPPSEERIRNKAIDWQEELIGKHFADRWEPVSKGFS